MTVSIHPSTTKKTHYFSPQELVDWVQEHQGSWTAGDQQGIFHCKIPSHWVKGEILTLKEGVTYEAEVSFVRRPGVQEDPRQSTRIKGVADILDSADVILYSHEKLAAEGAASSAADFEIIAIRGLTSTPNPRPLNTLLHNVFGMSGGTPVEGSAAEKLEMIRLSFLFWKDRAMVG